MDVVAFTRALVDIESITGNEARVGQFLRDELANLGYDAKTVHAENGRSNIWATSPGHPKPQVVFLHSHGHGPSIHSVFRRRRPMSTGAVPATPKASSPPRSPPPRQLQHEGFMSACSSWSAKNATVWAPRSPTRLLLVRKFLMNGEPTENRIALASKGALRVEVIAQGKMAHSAYPELGDSAIDKLVDALNRLLAMKLPDNGGDRPLHLEYWPDRRRPGSQCHSRSRSRAIALSPGRPLRGAPKKYRRTSATSRTSSSLWRFPSCACAHSTEFPP